jgi:hypothetical protein
MVDRQKQRARSAANYAVRSGKIQVAGECQLCGEGGPLRLYIPDYSKPLDVVPVCVTCRSMMQAVLEGRPISVTARQLRGMA